MTEGMEQRGGGLANGFAPGGRRFGREARAAVGGDAERG